MNFLLGHPVEQLGWEAAAGVHVLFSNRVKHLIKLKERGASVKTKTTIILISMYEGDRRMRRVIH